MSDGSQTVREPGAEQNVVEAAEPVAEDAVAQETSGADETSADRAAGDQAPGDAPVTGAAEASDAEGARAGTAPVAAGAAVQSVDAVESVDAGPVDAGPVGARAVGAEAGGAEAAGSDVATATGAGSAGADSADAVAAGAVSADVGERRGGGLEEKAAEALHALVERGAEKIPGDQGSTISRFAVALLSFGSAMTERGRDKETKGTSALVSDAVQVFKSLDDDPAKQREAMERALTDLSSNLVGEQERGKALDVAQQAMGLWRSARGAGLSKSDDALSLRSLAGMLRKNGDEDGAAQTEEEARKLEK